MSTVDKVGKKFKARLVGSLKSKQAPASLSELEINEEENEVIAQKDSVNSATSSQTVIIEVTCKDFRVLRLSFPLEARERTRIEEEFIEQLKAGSCRECRDFLKVFPSHIQGVFAFLYKKAADNESEEGWDIYNPTEEYKRLGLTVKRWRLSNVNSEYRHCKSYPRELIVPTSISDEELLKVFEYRSSGRIPAAVWKHPKSDAVIVRCSQPRAGLLNETRCKEDESLFAAILENNSLFSHRLYIFDARPKVNAVANQAKGTGGGYENVESYKNTVIKFLGIENIHAVRNSYWKLHQLCQPNVHSEHPNWWSSLEQTHWLHHIRTILKGALRMAQLVETGYSVIVHCSDGWDRTSQLSALAQIMLDPYYRTVKGFMLLIEKEWLAFGHKFEERCGHFYSENEKEVSPIFLQFLDAVFQIQRQFPTAFEFSTKFLVTIADHLHTGLFGTFLLNSEHDRELSKIKKETVSLWSYLNASIHSFMNRLYVPTEGSILPNIAEPKIVLWAEYYLRFNEYLQPSKIQDHFVRDLYDSHIALQKKLSELLEKKEVSQETITEVFKTFFENRSFGEAYVEAQLSKKIILERTTTDAILFKRKTMVIPKSQIPQPVDNTFSRTKHSSFATPNSMDDLEKQGILKQGFLNKKSKDGTKWNARWCVVTNQGFFYFKHPKDTFPKKHIDFQKAKLNLSSQKMWGFEFEARYSTTCFAANSNEEMESWTKVLLEAMKQKPILTTSQSFSWKSARVPAPKKDNSTLLNGSRSENFSKN